ncbi:hypothetical protein [Lyngbya sp. CCY1209]|uniref:hypothetical protein n=1 Tax=Lyngbya sp. CCY1209 TaxID=2886103 RepID=UPI002D211366|nr:hypothetical protein [Lyngbya sp. CCY1209]MEB3883819.1 hypothetical protein [Lyngbya sp. CCY1209]
MKQSTETLIMFAQLLETEPPLLPKDALKTMQELAAELKALSETDLEKASELIITRIGQFPQVLKEFKKALDYQRKEVDDIQEPEPNQQKWTIPNFQIIEETEETVIVTPTSESDKTSLFLYVRQSVSRWIQKNQ